MTLQWPNGNKVIVSEIVLWPCTIISGYVSNIRLWSPLSRFSPWRVSKKNKSYIVVALHCCSSDWLGKVPDYKQSLLFDEIKKIDSQSLHVATGIAQLKGASSKASWLPNPLSSNNNYLCQGSCLCFLYFACMYIKNNFLTLLQSHFWKFCFVQIDIPRFRIFRHSAS